MKLFRVASPIAVLETIQQGTWNPDSVSFPAKDIIAKLQLKEPDSVMIAYNGAYFLCPKEVIKNAMDREKALAQHSEHYHIGDMFTPTVIRLSQCQKIDANYAMLMVSYR